MSAVSTAAAQGAAGSANTAKSRRLALALVLLFAAVSVLPPLMTHGCRLMDFRAIYIGTRAVMAHQNPYDTSNLDHEYRAEGGPFPEDNALVHQNLTLYVNLPTSFVVTAPFAALPWVPAHLLWMYLTSALFMAALLLMWRLGAEYSLEMATLLACLFAVNCQAGFYTGNLANIVVGLCVIAVWCFLRDRLGWLGVLCLGLSLAVKPHDTGFVWLYFVLVGGLPRKRALQSLAVTAAIAVAGAVWVGHVAPHWLPDLRANLTTIAAPGGINDPGPHAVMGENSSLVVDLQAALSIFWDDARFYNLTSYLVCGGLLLVWMVRTLRSRMTVERAWLGLSAVTALTMLITYHRPWDAKLVMLAIPACCMLWARGGWLRKAAFVVTALTIVFTGDLTAGAFTLLYQHVRPGLETLGGKVATLLILRPVSLALLGMGVFYLWLYVWPPAGEADRALAEWVDMDDSKIV